MNKSRNINIINKLNEVVEFERKQQSKGVKSNNVKYNAPYIGEYNDLYYVNGAIIVKIKNLTAEEETLVRSELPLIRTDEVVKRLKAGVKPIENNHKDIGDSKGGSLFDLDELDYTTLDNKIEEVKGLVKDGLIKKGQEIVYIGGNKYSMKYIQYALKLLGKRNEFKANKAYLCKSNSNGIEGVKEYHSLKLYNDKVEIIILPMF
jgi:hypothetical protein